VPPAAKTGSIGPNGITGQMPRNYHPGRTGGSFEYAHVLSHMSGDGWGRDKRVVISVLITTTQFPRRLTKEKAGAGRSDSRPSGSVPPLPRRAKRTSATAVTPAPVGSSLSSVLFCIVLYPVAQWQASDELVGEL
jgi:hypothetical protein